MGIVIVSPLGSQRIITGDHREKRKPPRDVTDGYDWKSDQGDANWSFL